MLSLVTDRTAADAATAAALYQRITTDGWSALSTAEKASWLSALNKGLYRTADMNRVGDALIYLDDLLNSYGYTVVVNPKTDWDADDFAPTPTQAAAFLADLEAIKLAFFGTVELPALLDNINYEDANNIERLLLEIETLIESMVGTFLFSGGFYSGTDLQIQLLTGEI